jgi:hypothetical protein
LFLFLFEEETANSFCCPSLSVHQGIPSGYLLLLSEKSSQNLAEIWDQIIWM